MNTNIYGLIDPRSGRIRYVGKADDVKDRLARHCRDKGDNYKCRWIRVLKRLGIKPLTVLLDNVPKMDWQKWERLWISELRENHNLVNSVDGGIGSENPSAETRNKMSIAHKGKKLPPLTNERKQKMSESLKNTFRSAEAKRKLSAGQYRRYENENERRKTGDAQRGKHRTPLTEEQKREISSRLKGRKFTEEHMRNLRIGIALRDKRKEEQK